MDPNADMNIYLSVTECGQSTHGTSTKSVMNPIPTLTPHGMSTQVQQGACRHMCGRDSEEFMQQTQQ